MSQAVHQHDLTLHLNELLDGLKDFQVILDNEALLLKQHEMGLLLELLPKKQKQSDALDRLVKQIETKFNLPPNLTMLSTHPDFLRQNQESQKQLSEISLLAEVCKNLNMRNGITIQALDNINTQLTNLFSSGYTAPISLYNASGEKKQSGSKATLGKA